jgi:hypothetical protein
MLVYNVCTMEDIVLGVHIITLFVVASIILIADYNAFQWFRGSVPALNRASVIRQHRYIWIGLCAMLITGATLFWFSRDVLLNRPAFFVKMAFVLILLVNGALIGRLMQIATVRSFASLTRNEKMLVIASGALSTIGWFGALTSAFFLLPE